MVGTGLSETPAAYRTKLVAQDDAQLDAWVAGSLRDIAKRRGVVKSVHELSKATGLDDDALAGAFTLGGGAAAAAPDAALEAELPPAALPADLPCPGVGKRFRVSDPSGLVWARKFRRWPTVHSMPGGSSNKRPRSSKAS